MQAVIGRSAEPRNRSVQRTPSRAWLHTIGDRSGLDIEAARWRIIAVRYRIGLDVRARTLAPEDAYPEAVLAHRSLDHLQEVFAAFRRQRSVRPYRIRVLKVGPKVIDVPGRWAHAKLNALMLVDGGEQADDEHGILKAGQRVLFAGT
jgi:hypothetical protein